MFLSVSKFLYIAFNSITLENLKDFTELFRQSKRNWSGQTLEATLVFLKNTSLKLLLIMLVGKDVMPKYIGWLHGFSLGNTIVNLLLCLRTLSYKYGFIYITDVDYPTRMKRKI